MTRNGEFYNTNAGLGGANDSWSLEHKIIEESRNFPDSVRLKISPCQKI